MANYVFTYSGPGGSPEGMSEDEVAQVMAAWHAWYESMGSAVVDGGNPFGQSLTVSAGGATTEGAASGLTGYTIVSADSLELAGKIAAGCPILDAGGVVDVYETIEM